MMLDFLATFPLCSRALSPAAKEVANMYTSSVFYKSGGSSHTDYRDMDVAVRYSRERARDPRVSHVELSRGDVIIWDSLEGEKVRLSNSAGAA